MEALDKKSEEGDKEHFFRAFIYFWFEQHMYTVQNSENIAKRIRSYLYKPTTQE